MPKDFSFVRDDVLPSFWANAIQEFLSGLNAGIHLEQASDTMVEIPAGTGNDLVAISIDGLWRYRSSTVQRSHPGGAADTYPVFVTCKNNDIRTIPQPFSDFTDYAFDLAVTAPDGTPAIVPGVVDHFRKIGEVEWDGARITKVRQLVGIVDPPPAALIREGPLTSADVDALAEPGQTVFETNAGGDVVVEWVRAVA